MNLFFFVLFPPSSTLITPLSCPLFSDSLRNHGQQSGHGKSSGITPSAVEYTYIFAFFSLIISWMRVKESVIK